MSSRAIRRLREEKEAEERQQQQEEEEEYDDESEEVNRGKKGFHMMMHDFSSSSEEEESDSDDDDNDDDDDDGSDNDEEESEEEEDIDAILSEFQSTTKMSNSDAAAASSSDEPPWNVLYQTNDTRDFDLEHSMRQVLGAHAPNDDFLLQPQQQQQAQNVPRQRGRAAAAALSSRRRYLFGTPNPQWAQHRPPTYVAGGLGMVNTHTNSNENHDRPPCWPYDSLPSSSHYHPHSDKNNSVVVAWYTFNPSDTYTNTTQHYDDLSSSSSAMGGAMGDVNALALFVAENPYHAEAVLQLAMVLFHVNDRQNAMDLLKRCLWVYECASIQGFLPNEKKNNNKKKNNFVVLMDYAQRCNNGFFSALFRLMQTSCMVGCLNTSLAIAKFLLSLDPLRDPMGVLLTLDYFALATANNVNDQFIVDLVDSKMVQIYHKEEEKYTATDKCYECDLLDMPNWAFSYALALYRSSLAAANNNNDDEDECKELSSKANKALQTALTNFPSVLLFMLEKNNIDVQSRSFKTDWPSVLPYFDQKINTKMAVASNIDNGDDEIVMDEDTMKRAQLGTERIIKIFVQRSHKLWSTDDVIGWLYDNSAALVQKETTSSTVGEEQTNIENEAEKDDDDKGEKSEEDPPGLSPPPRPNPALIRYMQCDPSDYEDTFRTLPADANPLDQALLGPAMALDPNRRRILRRNRGGGGRAGAGADADEFELQQQLMMQAQGGVMLGGEMVNIDPDSPMLEVFWRSLLPWARVEGVPPPRR